MSKEKAIALLGTAKTMQSPEDMRSLIAKALRLLDTEIDLVPGLELTRDMIYEGLQQLHRNMPDYADTPAERSEKIHICESALSQIKEYAIMGLKARAQGSLDVAEDLLKVHLNHSLGDYSKEETSCTIRTDKSEVTVGPKEIETLERVIADDPRIKALKEGA